MGTERRRQSQAVSGLVLMRHENGCGKDGKVQNLTSVQESGGVM